ncbi:MAG: hypothetical protein AMS27_06990 [Bacteroides sp. SM23_62_1]|nr:MAG: hypothetical protein AMS27_06990 [Bacteroides sp. SM23_62_1]
MIILRIVNIAAIFLTLFLHSCSRKWCTRCWADGSSILNVRGSADIRICADSEDELLLLIDYTESIGYECEKND